MSSCFYDQPSCSLSLSKEHVISASVLRAVFGNPIRNVTGAELYGKKQIKDHEPVVRDVCEKCNNQYLSPYDAAGVSFISQLIPSNDPTDLELLVSRESLGWLIKTHLNYIRVVKDRETNEIYPISKQLKTALIQQSDIPNSLLRLMIEGWVGESYFWDPDDPRRIPWFSYRSVRFPTQRIVISDLRIKTLTTWIVIPSDASYKDFSNRASSALQQVTRQFGHKLQYVDPRQATKDGHIQLTHILPIEAVKRFITSVK